MNLFGPDGMKNLDFPAGDGFALPPIVMKTFVF
jgi:hypothetical protein